MLTSKFGILMKKQISDIILASILVVVTAYFSVSVVNFHIPPFEDAAMLMRYADHLAHGKGIVWNIGEAPLDGATDFLLMIILALVQQLGFSVEAAVRIVTISSHFATVLLIYFGMRRIQLAGLLPAFMSALYFAVGPGLFLSAAYFGTPFFALCVVFAWLLAQKLFLAGNRSGYWYLCFSLACLTAGLVRPEGNLISGFMLAALAILMPRQQFFRLACVFCGVFLVLGGAYFLWRWYHFGHPLPNPFYKKGGGGIYALSLKTSVLNSLSLGLPFIPMALLAARSKKTLIMGVAFLIPILGTTCMWVFLSDEMNFGGRFQYPLLGLYILSWYPLVRDLLNEVDLPRFVYSSPIGKYLAVAVVSLALGLILLMQARNSSLITYARDGRYDLGMMLRGYEDRGYTIATTEAGLLPLYSRWRAIDTWGLNDKWIAHNGGVTDEYLRQQKPDLIVWHEYFSSNIPPKDEKSEDPWFKQVMTLKRYAEDHGFTLAAVYGRNPGDTHYYYVRSDMPDHNEIVQAIRSTPYYWFADGGLCTNYAS